jgi:uncharacterized protein (TIGR02246 family)
MSEDERAIRDLVATWLAAGRAGDQATVLGLIAEDALFMVPGQTPFGKQAFAAASEGQRPFEVEAKADIQEIHIHGDWAWLRNHLKVTITPAEGAVPVRRSGYTLTILRKEPAGNWLLVRDANLMTADAA